jgi:aminoglycoside phosphotransferase (APT) family kinase protein
MNAYAPKLSEAAPIAKGFASEVYAWGEGRVLKLYHGWVARAQAQHEYTVTRALRAAGQPVPAAFAMCEVDGRHGIVFERVDGVSLLGYTQARPWALFGAIRLLAELHAQIHRCQGPAELPLLRERIARGIDAAPNVSAADRQTARQRLAELPDGTALCHGDFHPANVLLTARGPVVIDWDSASRGDPLGDVACTSRLIKTAGLPPWAPGYAHLLLRCLRPMMQRSYLRRSCELHTGTRRQIEAWQAPIAVAARSWRAKP